MTASMVGDWTEMYYEAVEDYFWRPKMIGRMPMEKRRGWPHWEAGLRAQEVPLNHILNIFFALAPQAMSSITEIRVNTVGSA
jgi:hypothetical protein